MMSRLVRKVGNRGKIAGRQSKERNADQALPEWDRGWTRARRSGVGLAGRFAPDGAGARRGRDRLRRAGSRPGSAGGGPGTRRGRPRRWGFRERRGRVAGLLAAGRRRALRTRRREQESLVPAFSTFSDAALGTLS